MGIGLGSIERYGRCEFIHGAYLVVAAVPILVGIFYVIRRHCARVAMAQTWARISPDIPLEVVESPYRELVKPAVAYVRSIQTFGLLPDMYGRKVLAARRC